MKLCIPTLCNYDGVDALIRSAEAGTVKPSGYVIVDNGGEYTQERANLMCLTRYVSATVIHPGRNLGVAASWNLCLEHDGRAEPIVISNDDIVLGPEAFELLMRLTAEHPRAGFGWALFVQRPDCTEKVGYYDENFWPAYYEDIDYRIRMARAGVPDLPLEGIIDITHSGFTTERQLGSPRWITDGRTRSVSYIAAKWGTDWATPGKAQEAYNEPFRVTGPPPNWSARKPLRGAPWPLRWEIINEIAALIGARRYLELGIATGECIERVEVAERWGVDTANPPNVPGVRFAQMTTDEFFDIYSEEKFDLIFIDADHDHRQVDRDIENALSALNPGGVILLHDCSPFNQAMQEVPYTNQHHFWTGDVWKSIVRLRWQGEHAVRVIDTNFGVGILIPGGKADGLAHRPYKPEVVTYADLAEHRADLLGLMGHWEWREWFERMWAATRTPSTEPAPPPPSEQASELIVSRMRETAPKYYREQATTADPTTNSGFLTPDVLAERLGRNREMQARMMAGGGEKELVVIFSKLPRADTTGTHLLRALEQISSMPVRHYEPLRAGSDGFVARGNQELDLSRARAILCIDDDYGWPVPEAPGIPKYYWCIDSYRMHEPLYLGGRRNERIKQGFDQVFYAQECHAKLFESSTWNWLPVGVDLSAWRYEPRTEKIYDFACVCNPNYRRAEFLATLQREFPRSFVGQAYGEDANLIYNQSHLVVNLSAGGDVNMRMFEGQATSALCLSNRIDNGEAELFPYLPLYDSLEDCIAQMHFYLQHETPRVVIARAQADAMDEHSYTQRAVRFLDMSGL